MKSSRRLKKEKEIQKCNMEVEKEDTEGRRKKE
jgi:hypothetical protein